MGKKLYVTDLTGHETAFIQQKVFSMMPRFFVYIDGVERAEIVKRLTFLRKIRNRGSRLDDRG